MSKNVCIKVDVKQCPQNPEGLLPWFKQIKEAYDRGHFHKANIIQISKDIHDSLHKHLRETTGAVFGSAPIGNIYGMRVEVI